MWRRAPSTSRRQLVPDAVDISKRPSVRPFFFFFLSTRKLVKTQGKGPPTIYCSVYCTQLLSMPISCRVSLRLIALVTRLHICRGENSSLSQLFDLDAWFFSSLFLGVLVFSRIPFGALHRHPPPFFLCLAFSTVYLGTCIHFFFDFSTKWKNKFFLFWNSKMKVCPGLRSIDSNYNQMKGKRKFFWITK